MDTHLCRNIEYLFTGRLGPFKLRRTAKSVVRSKRAGTEHRKQCSDRTGSTFHATTVHRNYNLFAVLAATTITGYRVDLCPPRDRVTVSSRPRNIPRRHLSPRLKRTLSSDVPRSRDSSLSPPRASDDSPAACRRSRGMKSRRALYKRQSSFQESRAAALT